jgi:hypothetical protein
LSLKQRIHTRGCRLREKCLQILFASQCDCSTNEIIDRRLAFRFHPPPGTVGYTRPIGGFCLAPTQTKAARADARANSRRYLYRRFKHRPYMDNFNS